MEIVKFGLGLRFDVMEGEEEQATPKQLWEEVFSVLTVSDTWGLHVFGGMVSSAEFASDEPCYICVLSNGRLSQMRRVFRKLEEDAGVSMYLAATHPFLQSNALKNVEWSDLLRQNTADGTLHGGARGLVRDSRMQKARQTPPGRQGHRVPARAGCVWRGVNVQAGDTKADIGGEKAFHRRSHIAPAHCKRRRRYGGRYSDRMQRHGQNRANSGTPRGKDAGAVCRAARHHGPY